MNTSAAYETVQLKARLKEKEKEIRGLKARAEANGGGGGAGKTAEDKKNERMEEAARKSHVAKAEELLEAMYDPESKISKMFEQQGLPADLFAATSTGG